MATAPGTTSTTRSRVSGGSTGSAQANPEVRQAAVARHAAAIRANAVLALSVGDKVAWAVTPEEFCPDAVGTIVGFREDEVRVRFPAEAMRQTVGDLIADIDTRTEFADFVKPDSLVPMRRARS